MCASDSYPAGLTRISVASDEATETAVLRFDYDYTIVELIKKIPGKRWVPDKKVWTIPLRDDLQRYLQNFFKGYGYCIFAEAEKPVNPTGGKIATTKPVDQKITEPPGDLIYNKPATIKTPPKEMLSAPPKAFSLPKDFIETMQKRRQGKSTIKSYSHHLKLFLEFVDKPPEEVADADISAYILRCAENDRRSASFQKAAINAIKYYYEKVLHRTVSKDAATWPKVEHKLPVVFSMEEVTLLLKNVENLKHRCILYIIYSGGLRRHEVVKLKVSDIDFDRKQIRVRQAKGKKDRYTILSDKAAELLKQYLNAYQPSDWFFKVRRAGNIQPTAFSGSSKKHLKKYNSKKKQHCTL